MHASKQSKIMFYLMESLLICSLDSLNMFEDTNFSFENSLQSVSLASIGQSSSTHVQLPFAEAHMCTFSSNGCLTHPDNRL